MTSPLPIAAIGADGIIWLVLAVLWGLAQLLGLGKKKSPLPSIPMPENTPETEDVNKQIQELFTALSGAAAGEKPPPVAPPPIKPAPRVKNTQAPRKAAVHRTAAHMAPGARAATPQTPPPVLAPLHDETPPLLSMRQKSSLLPKMVSFKMKTIRLPALGMKGFRSNHEWKGLRPDLKGREHLQAAMINRIVLGPARGLE